MEMIPSDPSFDSSRVASEGHRMIGGISQREHTVPQGGENEQETSLDLRSIARRYWVLLLCLILFGAGAGFTSVVFSSPMYRTRLLLEVRNLNDSFLRNTMGASSDEASEVGIQTQINILRSGQFLRRGAERLQADTVPLAPTGRDLFSRIRERVNPASRDPLENAKRGLFSALKTFDARPVIRTRLIELTCESTSPDVAAQFLNSMATEFVEDTTRSRMQNSQKTSEWLAAQIEETKSKVQESEEKLRDFVQASGNLFAGQETTLDDTKLVQLKNELARIQTERIAKQTKYERVLKNSPETLPEILDDPALRAYQARISALRQERAALEIVFTAKYEKVRKIDAQIALLEKTYRDEVDSVLKKIQNEYESALRHEKLLLSNYSGQSQRVGAAAGKAAQYNALRREVDTLRAMYQTLLTQSNQAGIAGSVPINPIRIVESSVPPTAPYKPSPILNISLGTMLGIAVCAGIVFLRERADRSIKSPGSTRFLLNAPELGVIPNLRLNGDGSTKSARTLTSKARTLPLNGDPAGPVTALVTWQNAPDFLAESFRGTLASILRNQVSGKTQKSILITSAGPGEGKTTVVQNLGIALAETGRKVLLVDGDFRRPNLHHRFGLANDRSLVDLLASKIPVTDRTAELFEASTSFAGLSVLPNRATQDNVAKLLYSLRLRSIFEALTEKYDMILVDAPPILHLADARIIAPLTDALVLVLRAGVTDRKEALEAYQRIQEDGLYLLGTVLTDCVNSVPKRSYYYDYVNNGRQ